MEADPRARQPPAQGRLGHQKLDEAEDSCLELSGGGRPRDTSISGF